MKRCEWCESPRDARDAGLYIQYHDTEWGVPVFDDRKHFEFLVLESAQAGLSWITILKKRENYRRAYDNFDVEKAARYTEKKKERLLADPGIVRNRLKIEASITNARKFLEIQKEFGSFSNYIWGFAENGAPGGAANGRRDPAVKNRKACFRPVVGKWKSLSELPARTELSDKIAADMKKRGFRFLGSIILYSHMQATGIVNDHITSCFRYGEIKRMYR
ncbi:MAG: DNA-3-methyladenine glycosylase I [Treponema sp.]|jgi:DNA-3-methyladenine glycosylase I|nr:DNA-3-methyladenine glycosylase I [Treponema sp.]